MKEVSEKITERIRKLIRLKESATQIGSEGEAHAAAAAVHRLLMEYNLSLLDLAGENPQNRLTACESDRISYKDAAGNIWKRDLMRVLCEYNYCKMLLYAGTTHAGKSASCTITQSAGNRPHDLSPKTDRRLYGQVQACQKKACGEQA